MHNRFGVRFYMVGFKFLCFPPTTRLSGCHLFNKQYYFFIAKAGKRVYNYLV